VRRIRRDAHHNLPASGHPGDGDGVDRPAGSHGGHRGDECSRCAACDNIACVEVCHLVREDRSEEDRRIVGQRRLDGVTADADLQRVLRRNGLVDPGVVLRDADAAGVFVIAILEGAQGNQLPRIVEPASATITRCPTELKRQRRGRNEPKRTKIRDKIVGSKPKNAVADAVDDVLTAALLAVVGAEAPSCRAGSAVADDGDMCSHVIGASEADRRCDGDRACRVSKRDVVQGSAPSPGIAGVGDEFADGVRLARVCKEVRAGAKDQAGVGLVCNLVSADEQPVLIDHNAASACENCACRINAADPDNRVVNRVLPVNLVRAARHIVPHHREQQPRLQRLQQQTPPR